MSSDEVDAVSEDGPKNAVKFVRWFFDTTKDVKGCKDDIAECDVSYWMVVTRSQGGGEEVIEILTENDLSLIHI